MTTFTRTWDSNYSGSPLDTDDSSGGAQQIRNLKDDIFERMIVDHSWVGDVNDGKHIQVTLRQAGSDPTLDAGDVALYAKPVGNKSQLFFLDQDGNAVQLTFAGQGQTLPAGVVVDFAGIIPPGGFLLCFGQAVSRTTYAALFSAIGTTYGNGDGSSTFNLPDIRGRVIAGLDNMGGVAAGRMTVQISGSTLGAVAGEEQHVLVVGEMPSHTHAITDTGHTHSGLFQPHNFGGPSDNVSQGGPFNHLWRDDNNGGPIPYSSNNAVTGITLANTGSGTAHNNLQPTIMMNKLIKT